MIEYTRQEIDKKSQEGRKLTMWKSITVSPLDAELEAILLEAAHRTEAGV